MLSVSSYIIMKEKSFFYNQISNSKEIEYRNINLFLSLRKKAGKENKDLMDYYTKADAFLKAFSKKIELPNIFEEKINILKDMENNLSYKELEKKYPDYSKVDFDRLKKLLISNHNILSKIAVKMSKTKDLDIKRREIFSATHFKSFNKPFEPTDIKIIAFVIFYVALKKGITGMDNLSSEDIYNTIMNTDYYYYIDSRIMKIYQENPDVFDAIISDAFSKGGRKK